MHPGRPIERSTCSRVAVAEEGCLNIERSPPGWIRRRGSGFPLNCWDNGDVPSFCPLCGEYSLIKSAHSPVLGMHYSEQEDVPWWAEWYFLKLGNKLHPPCPDVKDRFDLVATL